MRWDDVVGYDSVKERLQKSIDEERIPHNLMFVGQRGSSGLPLALAYASAIIRKSSKNPNLVDQQLERLEHPDLHFCFPLRPTKGYKSEQLTSAAFMEEWKAFIQKSKGYSLEHEWLKSLSVEMMNGQIYKRQGDEIIRTMNARPTDSDHSVLIIWLAERMNGKSVNMLLKLFEEPRPGRTIIMATEQVDLILPTMLSRAQQVRIGSLSRAKMEEALIERQGVNPAQARQFAMLAEGSYTNALRLCASGSDVNFEALFKQWARAVYNRKFSEILPWQNNVVKLGKVMQGQFLKYALHMIRETVVENYGNDELLHSNEEEAKFAKNFSPFFPGNSAMQMAEEIERALEYIDRNANPKMVFMNLTLSFMKTIIK